MNAYPEYIESGIDWLGKIPSHWALSKIKYSFENLDNLREPIASENRERINPKYDYYGASGVIDKVDGYNVDDTVLLIAEDGANLVMRNLPLIYKASGKIWVNNHAHILKPLQDVDYEYMYYYLESIDYNDFITGSAQPKLSQGNLANVDVLRPTLSEQKAIAAYLDEKTGKIDELIAEKTKQVEDLRSYRTSFITETVTRGLNPNAPLRQSGIDWLGEIPEHWNVIATKRLFDIYSGATPQSSNEKYWDGDIVWITPADYNTIDHYISSGSRTITNDGYSSCSTELVPRGSIVFSKRAPIGKVAIAALDLCTNQGCLCCVPFKETNSIFFYYLMSILGDRYNQLGSGSTFLEIAVQSFADFKLVVPPISEQHEIADYLDEKTAKIDKLISELNTQLAELAEYKQAVISEAVTGKVDVRNYKS